VILSLLADCSFFSNLTRLKSAVTKRPHSVLQTAGSDLEPEAQSAEQKNESNVLAGEMNREAWELVYKALQAVQSRTAMMGPDVEPC
jgi:hypothetical protein